MAGLRRRGTLAHLREYERSQWLDPEQLAELQWRKLSRLVEHCWREVPYYRRRWGEAGASPAETLLVGDSWIDHETAARANTRVCLARYGFGFADIPPDRLRGNELLIDHPADLLAIAFER